MLINILLSHTPSKVTQQDFSRKGKYFPGISQRQVAGKSLYCYFIRGIHLAPVDVI